MATKEPSSSDAVLLPSIAAASATIIVKVGAEGKKYHLHTELLKHHSGYFRGALSGAFKETDDGVIPMTDIDIDAFDVFVDWLYRGTVRADLEYLRSNRDSGLTIASRSYVLADRLLVPGLKSALMDGYFNLFMGDLKYSYPGCHLIIYTFENLTENDPLLRLCVDLWSINNSLYSLNEYNKSQVPDLPQAFLVRMVLKMNEVGQTTSSGMILNREDYNEVAKVDK